jgi:cell wall-associated NlpC family hydrolase
MTTFQRFRLICSLFFAGIAFAGLQECAWAEELPPEQISVSSALTKLADFTTEASQLVLQAVGMLGIHYKYGGTTPENGLDCSGLVRYVYKEAWGTNLPRTSAEISHVGQRIDPHDLRPGDLVFYNTLKRGFSHVGIYLGGNKFIHSPSPGGDVRIESMDLNYWKRRFNGARRIAEPSAPKDAQ